MPRRSLQISPAQFLTPSSALQKFKLSRSHRIKTCNFPKIHQQKFKLRRHLAKIPQPAAALGLLPPESAKVAFRVGARISAWESNVTKFEYKVIPAPKKAHKVKGLKRGEDKFAASLAAIMNQQGAEGWEYQRTDTLPVESRAGLTSHTTTFQNMLIFRRIINDVDGDINVGSTPETPPVSAPEAPIAPAAPSVTPVAAAENLAVSDAQKTAEDQPEISNANA